MPVSSDIYSMVGRGVQPVDDPQNALLKALKLQGAQQELQTGSMKMDEYRRGVERGNRLQSLLTGKFATPDERAAAMEGGGFLDEADKYRKSIADRGKVEADTAKTRNEVIGAGLKRYREQLDYIESPQTAARWIQSQYQDPTIGPVMAKFGPVEEALSRIPQDPQAFAQWREQQTQGMEKYRASIEQKPTSVDAGGTKKFLDMNPKSPTYKQEISSTTVTETEAQRLARERQAADAKAGREVTIRGQDKVDARAREGSWSLNSDGVLVNSRSGETKAATGAGGKPGGSPKLTEIQGKATGFASRMEDAESTLSKFENKVWPSQVAMAGYKSDMPSWMPGGQIIGGAITAANKSFNPMVSDEAMAYQQAQENWVTANLRLESGAVIGPEEMQKEIQKYFPQPGEPKSIADQKKKARAVAQRAVKAQAGPGQNMIKDIVGPQGAEPSKEDYRKQADAILRGG